MNKAVANIRKLETEIAELRTEMNGILKIVKSKKEELEQARAEAIVTSNLLAGTWTYDERNYDTFFLSKPEHEITDNDRLLEDIDIYLGDLESGRAYLMHVGPRKQYVLQVPVAQANAIFRTLRIHIVEESIQQELSRMEQQEKDLLARKDALLAITPQPELKFSSVAPF